MEKYIKELREKIKKYSDYYYTNNESLISDVEFDLTIGELTAHIFGYKIIEGLPLVCKKDSFFINDYL